MAVWRVPSPTGIPLSRDARASIMSTAAVNWDGGSTRWRLSMPAGIVSIHGLDIAA